MTACISSRPSLLLRESIYAYILRSIDCYFEHLCFLACFLATLNSDRYLVFKVIQCHFHFHLICLNTHQILAPPNQIIISRIVKKDWVFTSLAEILSSSCLLKLTDFLLMLPQRFWNFAFVLLSLRICVCALLSSKMVPVNRIFIVSQRDFLPQHYRHLLGFEA